MDDEVDLFATFDKAPQFFEVLPEFLNVDLRCEPTATETQIELALVQKLSMIVRKQCLPPLPQLRDYPYSSKNIASKPIYLIRSWSKW